MADAARQELMCLPLRRMDYQVAFDMQVRLRDRCIDEPDGPSYLMPVEHPPVITIGRRGQAADVLAAGRRLEEMGVAVHRTNRGGQVTFHGPGQLVVYPIVDLRRRGPDLHRYLRDLQSWLVRLCASYGVTAHAKGPHTGCWVGERKIASIGIAVRRWVTYHGVALNVAPDLDYFDLIVPCGLPDVTMTSLKRETGHAPELNEVAQRAARFFAEDFGFDAVEAPERSAATL